MGKNSKFAKIWKLENDVEVGKILGNLEFGNLKKKNLKFSQNFENWKNFGNAKIIWNFGKNLENWEKILNFGNDLEIAK